MTAGRRWIGWGVVWLLCAGFALVPAVAGGEPLQGRLLCSRLTDGTWQIWQRDLATDRRTQLTFSPGDKRYPSWVAGDHVAYATSNQACYVMALVPGAAAEPICEDLWPMRDVAWAPDGARVAFAKFRTDLIDSANLWVSDARGQHRQLLTQEVGIQYHPSWSPDGTRVAYSGGHGYRTYELYVVNADGTGRRQLTHNQSHEFLPAWSPDGTAIAYSSDAAGNYDIWVIPAVGGAAKRLTDSPGLDTRPVWSPDGTQIAFVTNRSGVLEVWVMTADGTNQRLLEHADGGVCDPAWR